jgi:hypothetical protein
MCDEICNDGIDNDGDGKTDCDDLLCDGRSGCFEEDCQNAVDEDDDGDIDCDDSDCQTSEFCMEADCANGVDEDGDGLVDCADPGCRLDARCIEAACADGVDNDGDGLVDCADSDCGTECRERRCDDGNDNDMDGTIDCEDPDCVGHAACCESRCPLTDLGSRVGLAVAEGSSYGLCDSIHISGCGPETSGATLGDATYRFEAPADGRYDIDAFGSDYALNVSVYAAATCEEIELRSRLACNAGFRVSSLTMHRGQVVMIVLDSNFLVGSYVLNIIPR